jgi:hypothetical protein
MTPSPTPTPQGPTLKDNGWTLVVVGVGVIALGEVIMLISNPYAKGAGFFIVSGGLVMAGVGIMLRGIGKLRGRNKRG